MKFILDIPGLQNAMVISRYQFKAIQEMQNLLKEQPGGGELRFNQLILRASSLKKLHSQVLEEIFFARLIGSVQIDSVVPYILRMETSTYNGESGTFSPLFPLFSYSPIFNFTSPPDFYFLYSPPPFPFLFLHFFFPLPFHLLFSNIIFPFFTPHPSPHPTTYFILLLQLILVFIFFLDNHLSEDSTMNVKIEMDEEDLDEEEEELQSD